VELARRWAEAKSDESQVAKFSPDDVKDFNTAQRTVLLDEIEAATPYSSLIVKKLDEAYGIHETENAEIRLRFYRIALKSGKDYAETAASRSELVDRGVCI
jgi:leukotriene-A4 hydrolase